MPECLRYCALNQSHRVFHISLFLHCSICFTRWWKELIEFSSLPDLSSPRLHTTFIYLLLSRLSASKHYVIGFRVRQVVIDCSHRFRCELQLSCCPVFFQ